MDGQDASLLDSDLWGLLALSPDEPACSDAIESQTMEVEPGRKLIYAGRACLKLYLVKTGWLIDFKLLKDGSRQILGFRLPGDLVGTEVLAYPAPLHSTAALTHCTVVPFSADAFAAAAEHPRMASAFLLACLREGPSCANGGSVLDADQL